MKMPAFLLCCVAALGAAFSMPLPVQASNEVAPEHAKFFEGKVRPLLVQHCFKCHGEEKQKGQLRLDSRSAMLAGGESGAAIVPGKPEESPLIEAINYASFEMPPTGKLSATEIETLTEWVKLGAPWPGEDKPLVAHGNGRKRGIITEEDKSFWSFRPLSDPTVPHVAPAAWSHNPIDEFVFQKLAENGLTYAPEADRVTLIRRVTETLHGLPPTPAEVDAFVADKDPKAYEKLVDRLLDSPRYGEHWARHWLDLVRYAESDGYRADHYRPHAWRYRDYVVRAFNADKPYDQFLTEQLAGDEYAPEDPDARIATGFLRHSMYEYNQRDVRTQWSEMLNDVTDVTSDVVLGLGLGCARCHDHKFDPLLQKDYYRLQAFFAPMLPRNDVPPVAPAELAEYHEKLAAWEAETATLRAELDELKTPGTVKATRVAIEKFPEDIQVIMNKPAAERDPLEVQLAALVTRQIDFEFDRADYAKHVAKDKKERFAELTKQLEELEKKKPKALPVAMTVTDVGAVQMGTIIPGDRKNEKLSPGFLTVLGGEELQIVPPPKNPNSTGRRLALAEWLTRPDHPLTTRVIVNRVWQYHFGRGLVSTASDFGKLGEVPSHPEMLDWLARQMVARGWSFKQMHRLMLTSATYKQATEHPQAVANKVKDPDNRLFWRGFTKRLDAEQIRDAMLLVSGELDLKMSGPSVATGEPRRTIYTKVIRNTRDPLLDVFDFPENITSTPQRNSTTTATQALLMLNGDWTLARAQKFAGRLLKPNQTAAERINSAYRLAYGREPQPHEAAAVLTFLQAQADRRAPGAGQMVLAPYKEPPAKKPAAKKSAAEGTKDEVSKNGADVAKSEAEKADKAKADEEKEAADKERADKEEVAGEPAAEGSCDPKQNARCLEAVKSAWADLCHVLLNSNEFLYVD